MSNRFLKLRLLRIILVIVMLFACAFFLTSCGGDKLNEGTPTEKAIELKLSHFMASTHPQATGLQEPFATEVERVTEGRVKVAIYPGGSLASGPDHYNAAVTGIADIAFFVHGLTPGQFRLAAGMEQPFIVPSESAEAGSRMFWDLHEKFSDIAEADYKQTKLLWLYCADPGQLISNKPIYTIEDMKGLKIRSPSSDQNGLIEALGATPVNIPMPDVYDAMQKGVVNACLVPLSTIHDYNLQDVAKYITIGNFCVTTFGETINLDAWNKILPEDQAKIEEIVGQSLAIKAGKIFDDSVRLGLELAEKKGLEVYYLPDDELTRWKAAAKPILDKWIDKMEEDGFPGREFYEEVLRLQEEYK